MPMLHVAPPPVLEGGKRLPPVDGIPDGVLDGALSFALSLVPRPDPYAFPLLLDLPPVSGASPQEQEQLRTIAPLYLAAELESTRLLAAVEMLAGLWASGALPGDVGPAGELLHAFRRRTRERLTAAERDAVFGRLFGKPYGPAMASAGEGRNRAFEGHLIDLCDGLAALEPRAPFGPGTQGQVRVHTAAAGLAGNLVPRTGGVAAYAARECLEALRDALEILKVRQVQATFGAGSVWLAVREIARRYLGQETDIVSRIARGRAGTAVLGWLADVLPQVGQTSRSLVPAGSPVPGAAVAWMEATLRLYESSDSAAALAPPRAG